MPLPLVEASDTLRQFAASFAACFTAAGHLHFVTVLLGLIQAPERRTLSGLRRCVLGVGSLSALSRFCTSSAWTAALLAETWQARFHRQLAPRIQAEHARQRATRPRRRGRPTPTRVTAYAIFDDSPIAKHPQGRKAAMAGVGRHDSTAAGGVITGHSRFTGVLVVLGRRCPLPPRRYRQRAVAEREGVPFRSKVDLAVEAVERLRPLPGTEPHVLVDAWYTCRRLWQAALARGFRTTGGLRANRRLRLPDPEHPGQARQVRLSAYVAGLGPADFVRVPWRGRPVAAHLVRTFVSQLGACQVLVIKETPDAPPGTARCWASSDLGADVATVARHAALRWEVETSIQEGKELLGLDHDQVTSAMAIERFWHLVAGCYLYLDEVRAGLVADGRPQATLGDALRAEQAAHRRRLLSWLQDQFRQGATLEQVHQQLLTA